MMAGNVSIPSQVRTLSYLGEYGPVEGEKQARVASRAVARGDEGTEALATTPDKQTVSYLVDALNDMSRLVDRNLEFKVDDTTGRIIIRVTDGQTGELIREIPPKEMATATRESLDRLVGLLFDGTS